MNKSNRILLITLLLLHPILSLSTNKKKLSTELVTVFSKKTLENRFGENTTNRLILNQPTINDLGEIQEYCQAKCGKKNIILKCFLNDIDEKTIQCLQLFEYKSCNKNMPTIYFSPSNFTQVKTIPSCIASIIKDQDISIEKFSEECYQDCIHSGLDKLCIEENDKYVAVFNKNSKAFFQIPQDVQEKIQNGLKASVEKNKDIQNKVNELLNQKDVTVIVLPDEKKDEIVNTKEEKKHSNSLKKMYDKIVAEQNRNK